MDFSNPPPPKKKKFHIVSGYAMQSDENPWLKQFDDDCREETIA